MSKKYTNEELIDIYKHAKDKEEEIKVLVDLSDSDEATIIELLRDAGVYEGAYKVCIKCGRKFPGIYKRGHSNQCPECIKFKADYNRNIRVLKKNMAKMAELMAESNALIQDLENMKEKKDEK